MKVLCKTGVVAYWLGELTLFMSVHCKRDCFLRGVLFWITIQTLSTIFSPDKDVLRNSTVALNFEFGTLYFMPPNLSFLPYFLLTYCPISLLFMLPSYKSFDTFLQAHLYALATGCPICRIVWILGKGGPSSKAVSK